MLTYADVCYDRALRAETEAKRKVIQRAQGRQILIDDLELQQLRLQQAKDKVTDVNGGGGGRGGGADAAAKEEEEVGRREEEEGCHSSSKSAYAWDVYLQQQQVRMLTYADVC
jgi:hypothetical protein